MEKIRFIKIILYLFLFISAGLTTCKQDFNLEETLDGPEGKALTLSPDYAQVGVNGTLDFNAEGGFPGYKYSMIQGTGTIDPDTGLYTAPGTEGTEIISVKDSYGNTKTASIEVIIGAGTPVLIISPSSLTVFKGTNAAFTATGGIPPYTFSLTSGIGSITPGGLYTAPASTGTATIRVTDSDAVPSTDNATVTVTDIVTNVDYEVTSVEHIGGTTGGASFTAEFLVTNTGSSDGTGNISWTAYISSDTSAGAGDQVASTGSIADPIASAANSGYISVSGTWSETGGNYYIVVVISSSEDLNQLNNSSYTAVPVTVSDPPVADIDYYIESVSSSNTPAAASSAISETFTYRNRGSDAGSSSVFWTAYRSLDQSLDGSDTIINNGISASLGGNTGSAPVTITGTWPASAGAFYIIVKVTAADDINPLNNSGTGNQFVITAPPGNVDYVVTEITEEYPVIISDQPISEHFSIANIGGDSGGEDVTWTAYLSADTSVDGGDIIIGPGTASSALSAGGEEDDILINGFWPSSPGSYYLIVSIAAGDDDIPDNNTAYAGPFTVTTPPDYSVSSALIQTTGTPEALLNAAGEFSFVINNPVSAGDGTQSILWKVYRSFDNIYDAGDVLIKTGSCGALSSNSSSTSQLFGDVSWPSYGAYYYLIIRLTALDEINDTNNTYISPGFVETAETYTEGGENNDDSGPAASNYTDLDTVLAGSNLDEYQLIKITGTTDDSGGYDTYKLTLGPNATKLDFYAEWIPAADLVDIFLWDSSSTITSSVSTDTQTEPASPPSKNVGLTPGTVYKIGVQSKAAAGTSYTLYISTRP